MPFSWAFSFIYETEFPFQEMICPDWFPVKRTFPTKVWHNIASAPYFPNPEPFLEWTYLPCQVKKLTSFTQVAMRVSAFGLNPMLMIAAFGPFPFATS